VSSTQSAHTKQRRPFDLFRFKEVLISNRNSIRTAVLPHFDDMIDAVPALSSYAQPLRQKFSNNPNSATDDFLNMVLVYEDEVLWFQFLRALNSTTPLMTHRSQFITDEEWNNDEVKQIRMKHQHQ